MNTGFSPPKSVLASVREKLLLSPQSSVIFRIPLNPDEIDDLMALPQVVSLMVALPDEALAKRYPGRIGWYNASQYKTFFPKYITNNLVYVGVEWDFGFRAAYELWRAGAKKIILLSPIDGCVQTSVLQIALQELRKALIYRLGKTIAATIIEKLIYARFLYKLRSCKLIRSKSVNYVAKRILFIAGSLGPGGTERQIVNTILGLKTHGVVDISLLHEHSMTPPHDFYYPQIEKANIPCQQLATVTALSYEVPNLNNEIKQIRSFLSAAQIPESRILAYITEFKRRSPEVIHAWLDDVNVIAGIAAIFAGVPKVVLSCRSLAPTYFLFQQPYMRPLYQFLSEHPRVTILNNSHTGRKSYAEWLGTQEDQIKVIHNGFEFPSVSHIANASPDHPLLKEFQFPSGAIIVGSVMRLSEEKNPILWIKTAKLISQELENVIFLIVGDGPLKQELQLLANTLGIADKIRFLGKRYDAIDIISIMDVFVLTSRIEGLPNVLIEAQMLGIPVVATDVGGVREVVSDRVTGIIVSEHQADAIANAVLTLVNDPNLQCRSRELAPEIMRNRFSIERMIKQTLEVYGIQNQS